jgi:hypothetical protein
MSDASPRSLDELPELRPDSASLLLRDEVPVPALDEPLDPDPAELPLPELPLPDPAEPSPPEPAAPPPPEPDVCAQTVPTVRLLAATRAKTFVQLRSV